MPFSLLLSLIGFFAALGAAMYLSIQDPDDPEGNRKARRLCGFIGALPCFFFLLIFIATQYKG